MSNYHIDQLGRVVQEVPEPSALATLAKNTGTPYFDCTVQESGDVNTPTKRFDCTVQESGDVNTPTKRFDCTVQESGDVNLPSLGW